MNRAFCVAPMLDWTDRHERYFLRLISRHAVLYSEMITTGAILHGDRDRFLTYNEAEHPLALQLGGSDPMALATCARIAADYAYDEINLNVGCPSDRVKSGSFGACLMATPQLVADCVAAMQAEVTIPVTVKHRIGIDDRDSWDELCEFVETIAQTACNVFIVHARKAWLQGLSPKDNREIPPLQWEVVYRLKQTYPHLQFIINGGFTDLKTAKQQLDHVDGVMMGREVYQNPYVIAEVDQLFYGDTHIIPSRMEIMEQLLNYVETELSKGTHLHAMTRHLLGMFPGVPGARAFRRHISENATRKDAGIEVLEQALSLIQI